MTGVSTASPSAAGRSVPVSVVIPCYRSRATIRRAVDSVAAQTARPLEVILVDDCSDDGTRDELAALAREHDEGWIRVVELPANGGAAAARNAGWDIARGEFIAFLDADDAWHPDKLAVQHEFMARHPEFALTGHGHRQVGAPPVQHERVTGTGHEVIRFGKLLLSNRFITPSAMIRRDVPCRFLGGKRHMEDFLLWLTVSARGYGVAVLDAALAYIFKAPYGETGLSADIVAMEKGELDAYRQLRLAGHLGAIPALLLSAYSCSKFLKRIAVAFLLGRRAAMPWLFPLVYLTVTHSTTALLIIVGILGRPETAADIGIVHGATVATFYALSANTRNLILGRSASIAVPDILLVRAMLCIPLGIASLLLSLAGTTVAPWLAAGLVGRRVIEWFNEVHLCQAEVDRNARSAVAFFAVQCVLFALAAAALSLDSEFAPVAIAAWALAPLAMSARFLLGTARARLGAVPAAIRGIIAHAGSTAVSGLGIYAFRLLIVLLAPKDAAGDLFTAFAIGSFLGTLFANVLGPSVALHAVRTGRRDHMAPIRLALAGSVAAGSVATAIAVLLPAAFPLAGKSQLFWLATGLSLLGGAVMLRAQGVRLRVLGGDDGRDVFGPDVLIHIGLVGAVPLAYALAGVTGLATLYMANAILALLFYRSSEIGMPWTNGLTGTWRQRLPAVLAFLLAFPVFFQLAGRIYRSEDPIADSGGVLSELPLPVSILACYGGILLLGRYRLASRSFGFIVLFFAALLLSAVVTTAGSLGAERGKLLLLVQFLLPVFGLALGEMIEDGRTPGSRVETGLFWAAATLMPAQLAATWLRGELGLSHDLGLFSVYQHWQYVPFVLVAVALLATTALREEQPYRALGMPLLLASLVYAVAAYSMLATALAAIGIVLTLRSAGREHSRRFAVLLAGLSLAGLGAYLFLLRSTPEFSIKFHATVAKAGTHALPCLGEPAVFVSGDVRLEEGECRITAPPERPYHYLIAFDRHKASSSGALRVEGRLLGGGLTVGVVNGKTWAETRNVTEPGEFAVELAPGAGQFQAIIANFQPRPGEPPTEARITRMEWVLPPCVAEVPEYVSDLVRRSDAACTARGKPSHPFNYLVALRPHDTGPESRLVVEGHIVSGGVTAGVVRNNRWGTQQHFSAPGDFRAEIRPGPGRFQGVVANYLPDPQQPENDVRITSVRWEGLPPPGPAVAETPRIALPSWMVRFMPRNLEERIGDWLLFGTPIVSSPEKFLFGHAQPMAREVRTSAHNYYIDLAYNFGVLALLPIALLIAYTAVLVARYRRARPLPGSLWWLCGIVAFFVLVDSNFKVTLRQPYPGIMAYFLWGLLLARLRRPDSAQERAR